jgi:glycosyltransferase involved in cell wall biosynthesis
MPRDFSVVAIVAAYNEADIIEASVRDLIDHGISVYLLDDGSTDGTAQVVEPYVGRGVVGIEQLRPAHAAGPGEFALKAIVRRKAQLATELDAHWFINHDADEFRESPWVNVPLMDAIRRVDGLGYNAIDFASFDFQPTDDRDHGGEDVRTAFPFYSEAAPYDRVQIRCWKKTACVELESSGGHDTRFDGRKVFPVRFVLRHYPIRGQAHGERKVFAERQPRYAQQEQALGWHVQYEHLAEGTSFIRDSATLTRFDPIGVRINLSLRHREVEALEQSLEGLRSEIEARAKDLEARTADIDRLQGELRTRAAESAERGQRLERLGVELENTHAQLAARVGELTHALAQLKILDSELTETRAQVAHRTSELAARRDEIAGLNRGISGLNGEIAGLNRALEHRKAEVDNFQAVVADLLKQLDAFRQSLSWRWMAPARAVYSALLGLGPRTKDQGRTED